MRENHYKFECSEHSAKWYAWIFILAGMIFLAFISSPSDAHAADAKLYHYYSTCLPQGSCELETTASYLNWDSDEHPYGYCTETVANLWTDVNNAGVNYKSSVVYGDLWAGVYTAGCAEAGPWGVTQEGMFNSCNMDLSGATTVSVVTYPSSTSISQMIWYINNGGYPTGGYAITVYTLNFRNEPLDTNGCEGELCPLYEPDIDFIDPIQPDSDQSCDGRGLFSEQQGVDFFGFVNISTSTAYMAGFDLVENPMGNEPISALYLMILKKTGSTYGAFVEQYIPMPNLDEAGRWRYDKFKNPELHRNDLEGEYAYMLGVCYFNSWDEWESKEGNCFAYTPLYYYKVSNNEVRACGISDYSTTSVPFWVKVAEGIAKALFKPQFTDDLLKESISNVTGTIPITYWWQMKTAVEGAYSASSSYDLIIPLPKATGGMHDVSIDLGTTYKNRVNDDLPDSIQYRTWKYAGYVYDWVTWIFVLVLVFKLFGARITLATRGFIYGDPYENMRRDARNDSNLVMGRDKDLMTLKINRFKR